jgi:hypothetical protein
MQEMTKYFIITPFYLWYHQMQGTQKAQIFQVPSYSTSRTKAGLLLVRLRVEKFSAKMANG